MSCLQNEMILENLFEETVQAVNRDNAIDTAKARNPHARVIGVNPNLRDS